MNLLFAIDNQVVDQLLTTLYSIHVNTPKQQFDVYVMQKDKLKKTAKITAFCAKLGINYHPIVLGKAFLEDVPVTNRYPEIIYYRLLAQRYLPDDLTRILYLDVDILVINDLAVLYQLDLGKHLYAAASHSALTNNVTEPLNKIRLGNYEAESYYNSGIMLLNLQLIRAQVKTADIVDYIEQNKMALLLPDQDVLNGLYGHQIKKIPDERYNFDARHSPLYYALSNGQWDLDWVIKNTVILHFCGRDKPWKKDYHNRYAGLYKHYAYRTQQVLE
ncbi:glycosyltransferase family 8 protein [Loigolactobacillus backii]|uniref:glycosyltransferase family 8 protein n=1 Tax=Loigolactobacillus backii TaxID=375175 RepID=UPI0022FD86C8|nr:glycosyltransferase family 8 protein [Loigolactobacillus backii]MDA5387769.1 glycosyltransferase family 8 protein [Loigolactobacillus backii]MDA5390940.1 glycosyltransferase family 8 protein [Loigolactobacillus backii]